jgi:hypothetical protein
MQTEGAAQRWRAAFNRLLLEDPGALLEAPLEEAAAA